MNILSQTPRRGQSSRCSAFADLLPLLDSPGLDAEEDAAVRAHLRSCAACQAQRATYHQMTLDARRSLSPAATARRHQTEELLVAIMQDIPAAAPETDVSSPSTNPLKQHRPIRPRRLIAGLAPLAAVLVIVVVAATLFANHPRPGISTENQNAPKGPWSGLSAISMVSADDGWAVGGSGPCDANPINDTTLNGHCSTTNVDPLLMHYQHGTWTQVRVTFKGSLYTISMLSATDGWAGGDHLFVHYDGHTWKQMPIPSGILLERLQMLSDTDGWAVGRTGKTPAILRYDGRTWSAQPLPASLGISQQDSFDFSDLAMVSLTEGWVVGYLGSGVLTAIILHYANGQWTLQSSTKQAYLISISMSSATDGWAGGGAPSESPASSSPFLLHYTQGKWTEATSVNNTDETASAVSMASATAGWAMGGSGFNQYNGPWVTYLLHYNGQQWTTVPAFSLQHQAVQIGSLDMLSATDGWGVGSLTTFSDNTTTILSWKAVIVHYYNGVWSIFSTP